MEFITELGPILALLPAFVIAITNSIKDFVPSWFVFLLPYLISVLAMFGLFLVFNEQTLGVYMINAIIIAFGSSTAYDASKKVKSVKEQIKENNGITTGLLQDWESIHNFRSKSVWW